jgi:thiol-disulfide isomerase/thioredoxin
VLLALAALGLAARPVLVEAESPTARISDRVRGQHIARASPPLDRPELRPAASASHMRAEDAVLGVLVAGRARAYPWWVAKNHHVVNDVVEGVPVVVAFCEQCTGAAAFRRTVGGRVLSFAVAGVYNGTIILRDRETRTWWAPFSGRGLEGPLAGRRLERIPVALTRWDVWSARHPRGDVVWAPEAARQGHGAWYEPAKWGVVSEMGETLTHWDARLPENALVLGVEDARAYPLAALRASGGVLNDTAAERPLVVVASGPFEAGAYERRTKAGVLTFRPSPGLEAVMKDEETGSGWSGDGLAVNGPLKGERLQAADGYVVEWHVWSAYHPAGVLVEIPLAPVPAAPPAGLALPALTLPDLRGRRQPLPLAGRVNLVVLWAAWCPPCRTELPRVQRLAEAHAAQGLAAVGVALHLPDDEHEKAVVARFVAGARITFPIFLVDEPAYDRLELLSRSAGRPGLLLPTVLAVDGEGRVLAVLSGKEAEGLPQAVERLLR